MSVGVSGEKESVEREVSCEIRRPLTRRERHMSKETCTRFTSRFERDKRFDEKREKIKQWTTRPLGGSQAERERAVGEETADDRSDVVSSELVLRLYLHTSSSLCSFGSFQWKQTESFSTRPRYERTLLVSLRGPASASPGLRFHLFHPSTPNTQTPHTHTHTHLKDSHTHIHTTLSYLVVLLYLCKP